MLLFFMLVQVASVEIFFIASIEATLEDFTIILRNRLLYFALMHLEVLLKVGRRDETLLTIVADEWLIVSVCSFVSFQIWLLEFREWFTKLNFWSQFSKLQGKLRY